MKVKKRTAELERYISKNKLDGMYISSYENYRYYSGFTGSNCHLVVTPCERIIITDGRYYEQAKEQANDFRLVPQTASAKAAVAETVSALGIKRLGYETMKLTDFEVRALREACGGAELVPMEDFGTAARMVKDEEEISCIERAVYIADAALSELAAQLRAGMTEREVAAELEYLMAKKGSERCAFETISASGERGALPHGAPTGRVIEPGDMLTLDFGACWGGYMSDITRTLWFGEPSGELRRIWAAVYAAQQAAIDAVRPGIEAGELDRIHREVLCAHGCGEHIMHSLGHGVGLEIHEAPRVSNGSTTRLEVGMVITVEPGVYVPGVGGVRTEDMVLVTAHGRRVLTQSPHLIRV